MRLRSLSKRAAKCGVLIVLLSLAGMAMAHPGGLNKQGCHNNRQTGDYHCHRAPAAPSAPMRLAPPSEPSNPGNRPGTSYPNCAAARAAGAAPVRRGDPGYGPHLDRDGDGIGCE